MNEAIIISGLLALISFITLVMVIAQPDLSYEIHGIDHGSGEPFTVYIGG